MEQQYLVAAATVHKTFCTPTFTQMNVQITHANQVYLPVGCSLGPGELS